MVFPMIPIHIHHKDQNTHLSALRCVVMIFYFTIIPS